MDRERIIQYIENCHLPDGGYFFAKVAPSSGLETYLATKALRLLGVETRNAKSVASFWEDRDAEGNLSDPFAIYLAVETYKELGLQAGIFKKYKKYLADHYKHIVSGSVYSENKRLSRKSFSLAMSYLGTLGRELEDLFYLVTLSRDLKVEVNKEEVIKAVVSLQNRDGGFGRGRESHLMTTYHALSILELLSFDFSEQQKVCNYLIEQWEGCSFLEDLFHIVESLALIHKSLPDVNKVIQFVDSCQRNNGGFGRAPVMSIATIVDTYFAVSIAKICETYSHKKFLR
jgi:hypothetical protein